MREKKERKEMRRGSKNWGGNERKEGVRGWWGKKKEKKKKKKK